VTGSENFQRKLQDMAENARRLHGFRVSLDELMSPEFISGCSSHASLGDLFAASPFKLESLGDFNAISDSDWDAFIRSQTSFANWEEMEKAAWIEWACRNDGSAIH